MKTILAVTVATVILLIASACGGRSEAPEPTATPSLPDPTVLYSAMADKIMAAPSLHVSVSVQGTDESGLMEVDFLPPDRAQVTLAIDPLGEGELTSEAIVIGDREFARFGGFQGWLEVPADEGDFSEVSQLVEFFSLLLSTGPTLTDIAEETLGEVQAFHIQGTLDKELLELLDETGGDDTATIDVWVGVEDTLPLRLLVQLMPSGLKLDISISLLDAPLPIEVPAPLVDIDIFDQLIDGSIDPEALSTLISVLPSDAQECLQAQLGQGSIDDLLSTEGELGIAEGLAIQSCLGDIIIDVGPIVGLGPDDLETGLSEIVGGATELLGLLPAEAEECIKDAVGGDVFEGWMSGEESPSPDQLVAIGPCIGGFDIGEVGEIELDVPDVDGLAQILGQLGAQVESCLRSVWGETAFDEIKSGSRAPNLAELGAMPGCVDAPQDAPQDAPGDEGSTDEASDLPDDFGGIFGQMPMQVLECLTAAVGAEASQELGDGTRLPGLTELGAIQSCFDEFEGGG